MTKKNNSKEINQENIEVEKTKKLIYNDLHEKYPLLEEQEINDCIDHACKKCLSGVNVYDWIDIDEEANAKAYYLNDKRLERDKKDAELEKKGIEIQKFEKKTRSFFMLISVLHHRKFEDVTNDDKFLNLFVKYLKSNLNLKEFISTDPDTKDLWSVFESEMK